MGTILGITRARQFERAAVFGSVRVLTRRLAQNSGATLHSEAFRRDPVLGLHLVRSGELVVRAALSNGPASFASGSVFVTQRPTRVSVGRSAVVTSLTIPAATAEGLPLPESTAWRLDKSPLLGPVSDFIVGAGEAVDPGLNGFSTYHFEHLLREMFLGLLIGTNRPTLSVGRREPFTEALAAIVVRCSDPTLTPAVVAQDVRLSLRQLQRQFRERGTTIGREIRRTRVEQALTVLRDRTRDALSIDEVAESVGFSGGSSLARAMAAEGHVSPTRAARTAGNGRSSGSGHAAEPVGSDRAA